MKYLVLERSENDKKYPNRTMAWMDYTPQNLLLMKKTFTLTHKLTTRKQVRYKITKV